MRELRRSAVWLQQRQYGRAAVGVHIEIRTRRSWCSQRSAWGCSAATLRGWRARRRAACKSCRCTSMRSRPPLTEVPWQLSGDDTFAGSRIAALDSVSEGGSVRTLDNETASHRLNEPFTVDEVQQALGRLRNHRAAGVEGYPAEFLRYAVIETPEGKTIMVLLPALTALMNAALNKGEVPDRWNINLVTAIYKRGNVAETGNYRPIAVGAPIMRLLAILVNERPRNAQSRSDFVRQSKLVSDLSCPASINCWHCSTSSIRQCRCTILLLCQSEGSI